MKAVKAAWAQVDTKKFGLYLVAKDKPKAQAEMLKTMTKLEAIKPLVLKVKTQCETAKAKHAKALPSAAIKLLDKIITDAGRFPTLLAEKKKQALEESKK